MCQAADGTRCRSRWSSLLGCGVGAWGLARRCATTLPSASLPEPHLALSATIYNLDITLADVDRGVYEELALRVACHPSESPEYLVTRVLAYCLEYMEGIAFGRGISEPDDPPIAVRDLTGALRAWIEIGSPDAARLHKASKAAPRVAVYTHKDPRILLRQLEGERIHRAEALEIYSFERELIDGLVSLLDRRVRLTVSVTDRQIYATIGDVTLTGAIEQHALAGPASNQR
jgi:uncharacterized protein YaeQ